jgi:hypothetical protein
MVFWLDGTSDCLRRPADEKPLQGNENHQENDLKLRMRKTA